MMGSQRKKTCISKLELSTIRIVTTQDMGTNMVPHETTIDNVFHLCHFFQTPCTRELPVYKKIKYVDSQELCKNRNVASRSSTGIILNAVFSPLSPPSLSLLNNAAMSNATPSLFIDSTLT